jgi:hypothetical protein
MTSQTFHVRVALASWMDTPLWPGLSNSTKILEPAAAKGVKQNNKEVIEI